MPMPVNALSSNVSDTTSKVSGDGLAIFLDSSDERVLVFSSDRSGTDRLYMSTR